MIFFERLKTSRTKKGLTQKEFASMIGISERSYQNYELGTREPNFEKLIAIAKYLDVSTDYLLGLTENPQRA